MISPVSALSLPLGRRLSGARPTMPAKGRREEGFSLLELVIVIAVLLISGAIALPMAKNVIRGLHLQQSASNYANLLQQARVRAVQDDRYYSVVASNNSTTCGASVTPCAFIDLNGDGLYEASNREPLLPINSDVKIMAYTSAPAYSSLEALFLPADPTGTTVNTATGPTFGPRGTPCKPTVSGSYTTCPSGTPTSYLTFMKNVRSQNWEAITLTPAGRVQLWSYNGSGTWSPMN